MGSVGDEFQSANRYLSGTYTLKMMPAEAYDALVFAPRAGPVTPL
jgi:hypothetical protein